jgi:hypothetical protein
VTMGGRVNLGRTSTAAGTARPTRLRGPSARSRVPDDLDTAATPNIAVICAEKATASQRADRYGNARVEAAGERCAAMGAFVCSSRHVRYATIDFTRRPSRQSPELPPWQCKGLVLQRHQRRDGLLTPRTAP